MDSIVLESNVKDMIVADCKDFMNSEEWYAERGIPYRRGYLLYGVPGSGKTSLIHALAGELGLDIYALSLSSKGMSDNTLTQLMGRIPTRCIVLMEDLDASFTHSTSRDSKSTGVPTAPTSTQAAEPDGNTLTLSGLLNAIDGVTAPEGRILVATTNHIDRLDEALRRPGRMDVWINFKYATKWQAEGIFKRFFPTKSKPSQSGSQTPTGSESSGNKNLPTEGSVADGVKRKRASTPLFALDEEELSTLAKKFGEQIPEDEVSVAGLQGFLLKNKARPRECVEEVAAWIVEERERREKLKKEKEEKEKKEKEEKEKKEKEEKEKADGDKKDGKETKTDDVAAARKAYRRAKKAAAAAAATLPTPPAEEPTVDLESKSSTDGDSSDSDDDVESATSDSDKKESKKSKKGKEKWVAVKQAEGLATPAASSTETTSTTEEKVEETNEEDTSAVDALVDAATKKTTATAEDVAATSS
ncbi:P-loop containing nucleoside triphosphate hydrolase protein [Serendipita vermifera]|nr:P-loop containing nucleoside triphosphate hydrolase protein [Serendipita vermifera]